jgi:hypothetical protein
VSLPKALFLLIALMVATEAKAQPANDFPFGLENLKWKMSYTEVKERLSASIPETAAFIGAPTTDQRQYFWGPINWKDCRLQIWTFFANDQLDYIYINPVLGLVSETCKTAMQDELVAHFGETGRKEFISPHSRKKMGIVMNWKTPDTIVSYGSARVNLEELGAPPLTIYDFVGPPVSK